MKKTILTAMLFFGFLVLGMQNVNAQYVSSEDAEILLQAEVQSIYNNTAYTNNQTKDAAWIQMDDKVTLYTFVAEQLANGATVESAVQQGVVRQNFLKSNSGQWAAVSAGKNHTPTPLEQEINDLLEQ